jgi:hypothetical protein
MKERPLGVTILAVVIIALALWSICWSLVGFGAFSVDAIAGIFGFGSISGAGFMGSFFGLFWGMVAFVVGVGLWQLAPWARSLAIIVAVVKLLGFVIAIFGPGGVDWIGAIISGAIIYYMTRPNIKAAFS